MYRRQGAQNENQSFARFVYRFFRNALPPPRGKGVVGINLELSLCLVAGERRLSS